MFLRTDGPPADAFAFARMGATLLPRTPRTLRTQVGERTFGGFGAVLLAERPASSDLSSRVARWRDRDEAGRPIVHAVDFAERPAPIEPHPDHLADPHGLNFALKVTTAPLFAWIALGLIAARATGRI